MVSSTTCEFFISLWSVVKPHIRSAQGHETLIFESMDLF